MSRAVFVARLLASCAHSPHPTTRGDTEPPLETLDTSLDATRQPSAPPRCVTRSAHGEGLCDDGETRLRRHAWTSAASLAQR